MTETLLTQLRLVQLALHLGARLPSSKKSPTGATAESMLRTTEELQQDLAARSNEDSPGPLGERPEWSSSFALRHRSSYGGKAPPRLFQSILMRNHSEKPHFHLGKRSIDRSQFIPTRLTEDRVSTSRHSGSTPVGQNAHFRTKLERAIPFTAFKLVLLT
ncbi:hypothetical protein ACQEVF_05415 [Nonomuraea polychroma]|uniref:hypothetical protein n=1 Tax=Nonomuraea polychroma TaxID=46176 RepID=UPI003D8CF47A